MQGRFFTVYSDAIRSNDHLTKIVFLPTPADKAEVPLNLATKAIGASSALTEIVFPSRLANFAADMIESCPGLTSVSVVGEGGNYTSKGEAAFENCTALGTITLPETLETIGTNCFTDCTSITSIYIPANTTPSSNSFDNWTNSQKIYIAISEVEAASGWTNGWNKKCAAVITWNADRADAE